MLNQVIWIAVTIFEGGRVESLFLEIFSGVIGMAKWQAIFESDVDSIQNLHEVYLGQLLT